MMTLKAHGKCKPPTLLCLEMQKFEPRRAYSETQFSIKSHLFSLSFFLSGAGVSWELITTSLNLCLNPNTNLKNCPKQAFGYIISRHSYKKKLYSPEIAMDFVLLAW